MPNLPSLSAWLQVSINDGSARKLFVVLHKQAQALLLYHDLDKCIDSIEMDSITQCGATGEGYEFVVYTKGSGSSSTTPKSASSTPARKSRAQSLAPPSQASADGRMFTMLAKSDEERNSFVDGILLWVDHVRRANARRSAKKQSGSERERILQDIQKKLDRRANAATKRELQQLKDQQASANSSRPSSMVLAAEVAAAATAAAASARRATAATAAVPGDQCPSCRFHEDEVRLLKEEVGLLRKELETYRALSTDDLAAAVDAPAAAVAADRIQRLQLEVDELKAENEVLLEQLAEISLKFEGD